MPPSPPAPDLSKGERIAFTTLGRNPRALCGIIVDPHARDRAGRQRILVAVDGRQYLARRGAIRRLSRPRATKAAKATA